MKSARFLRMIETTEGIGFFYHLSEPFYGSHHVFLGMDRLAWPCSAKGRINHIGPWLAPDAADNREVLENLGYAVTT